jgi:hypothetical protein
MLFIRQILEKKWEYSRTAHQLFIDFKKAYDSVRREVLYNILIGFGVPMKLVKLIKVCLNGTYSKLSIGKHLSDMGLHGLKKKDFTWWNTRGKRSWTYSIKITGF